MTWNGAITWILSPPIPHIVWLSFYNLEFWILYFLSILFSRNVSFHLSVGLDVYNLQLCCGMIGMLVCMSETSLAFLFAFHVSVYDKDLVLMIALKKRLKTSVCKIFPHIIAYLGLQIQSCHCQLFHFLWPLQPWHPQVFIFLPLYLFQGFYYKPGPGCRHPSTLNRVPGYSRP